VSFLSEVFDPVEEVVAHTGHILWTGVGLCSTIIEDCLMRAIPDTPEGLLKFRAVVEETKAFETTLLSKEFIKEDQLLLTGFMGDLDRHYAEKKRRRYLTQARSLILMDDYSTVVVGEETSTKDDGAFCLPRCKVSSRAQQLVTMAQEALEEAACSTSLQNQAALYGAARDILDLFRAIVVARHAKTLEGVPQLCAIFHNDCIYLAHHCLTLGHSYKSRFEAPLCHTATFVDMVPSFRQLAERYFGVQMAKQQAELTESLNSAQGFTRLEDEEAYTIANKAMMRVLHQLSHLGRIWQEVLPRGLYLRSIGALLDHAAQRLLQDIQKLNRMQQVGIGHLADLVSSMIQRAQELLAVEGTPYKPSDAVPSWPKLEATAGLLEVAKAPEHYVHGARRGQLAVVLTNLNQGFANEDPPEIVRNLLSYDEDLALTLVRRMQELVS